MMWFEKENALFQGFPSFRFCHILEIENSEISESFLLLQIFIVSIAVNMGKVKTSLNFKLIDLMTSCLTSNK